MKESRKGLKEMIEEEVTSILSSSMDDTVLGNLKFLQIVYTRLNSENLVLRRSIYYEAVGIFKNQNRVNSLIGHYSKKFGCNQEDFKIKSGSKGIFYGQLTFHYKKRLVQVHDKNLIPDMDEVESVECEVQNVVVIEKESIFNKAIGNMHITVCGKGYPYKNTIKLLKMLESRCRLFCLTDFDPYGLHIFLNYKKQVKNIVRLGIVYEDLFKYKISFESCIDLTKYDHRLLKVLKDSEVKEQAVFIEGLGFRLELEAIFNQSNFEFVHFLNEKLKEEY